MTPSLRVVATLGAAQTLAWGSTYYLPAVLAAPMAHELGVGTPTVFAAFSLALAATAVVGPAAGRFIDRRGGRPMLMATNLLFALGLVMLALAPSPWAMFAGWLVLGVGMGCGLYEAAFATLVHLYRVQARSPITGITLIAGFASTVGWPLSALMEAQFGWRGACLGWATLHLLVGLPLNARLPRASTAAWPEPDQAPVRAHAEPAPRRQTVLLAVVFALTAFISTAMAAHLPGVLQAAGASLVVAVGVGALIGPAQVAARLFEFGALRRFNPLWSARAAAAAHPLGIAALLVAGAPAAALFAILHGAGNGILTIARGTLPLAIFGADGYGARQGWLMLPARVLQALAPALFGLVLAHDGAAALWLSGALGLTVLAALAGLRAPAEPGLSAARRA